MTGTIKGPGIFLAQFAGDDAPFDNLPGIARWTAGLGYKCVQIPTWDRRLFELDRCAKSQTHADEVRGICTDAGVQITELSTHLQGQLIAVNPANDAAFDAFAPPCATIPPSGRPGPPIARHRIEVTGKALDDFANGQVDQARIDTMHGILGCR
jgi:sugar phosphate isomerase/epimerase